MEQGTLKRLVEKKINGSNFTLGEVTYESEPVDSTGNGDQYANELGAYTDYGIIYKGKLVDTQLMVLRLHSQKLFAFISYQNAGQLPDTNHTEEDVNSIQCYMDYLPESLDVLDLHDFQFVYNQTHTCEECGKFEGHDSLCPNRPENFDRYMN